MTSDVDNQTSEKWGDLLFGVRRSRRYHMHRQLFFERWNKLTNVVTLVFGATTVITILQDIAYHLPVIAACIVTIASILDLVAGTSKTSWLHAALAKRFTELEKEMVLIGEATDEDVRSFTAKRLGIEKDELPIVNVVNDICHREEMQSMGFTKEEIDKEVPELPLKKRFIGNFINFSQ